jgi:hypothetical protein
MGELCVHRHAYQREAQNLSVKSKKPQCKTQYNTSHTEKDLRLHTQWEELESENGQADNGGTAQNIVTAGVPFLEQDSDHDLEWFKPQSKVAKLRIGHEEPGLHSSSKTPTMNPSDSSHRAKGQSFGSHMKTWGSIPRTRVRQQKRTSIRVVQATTPNCKASDRP